MALAIYILLIHYSLPLNHDFTEPIFSHTSSTSDMVNKLNHIPTLSSTYWNMSCEFYQPILGIKIKLYSSKYFTQYNPEVKNNLHPLFPQDSPAKDGLLLFKYLKLGYRDTEPNCWLPTSSHALLFPCKRNSCFLFNQVLDSDWFF